MVIKTSATHKILDILTCVRKGIKNSLMATSTLYCTFGMSCTPCLYISHCMRCLHGVLVPSILVVKQSRRRIRFPSRCWHYVQVTSTFVCWRTGQLNSTSQIPTVGSPHILRRRAWVHYPSTPSPLISSRSMRKARSKPPAMPPACQPSSV